MACQCIHAFVYSYLQGVPLLSYMYGMPLLSHMVPVHARSNVALSTVIALLSCLVMIHQASGAVDYCVHMPVQVRV